MKSKQEQHLQERVQQIQRRDRIFLNNPVVMQGIGLAAIIIPATNLRNALILATAVALLLTPTRMLATFIGQHTGYKFRAILYALTSGVVYIGVGYCLDIIYGTSIQSVGIYLALLVADPLILKRYESPKRERLITSFKKGIVTTIGFCLVLFLVAGIREFLATGKLGGVEVITTQLWPLAALPAGGFIIVGLFIAIWQSAVFAFKRNLHAVAQEEANAA